jgi:hypothetical protein|nr:MAG TPA: hypothetical protein [Caudoviricetes sp.]
MIQIESHHVILILTAIMAAIVFYGLNAHKGDNTSSYPVIDYFKLMEIIDDIVDTHLQFKITLDYNIRRDGTTIDFEIEMKSITTDILVSISPDLLKNATLYVSDTYMIEYINNRVQNFLLEKMRTDKIKNN